MGDIKRTSWNVHSSLSSGLPASSRDKQHMRSLSWMRPVFKSLFLRPLEQVTDVLFESVELPLFEQLLLPKPLALLPADASRFFCLSTKCNIVLISIGSENIE